MQDSPLKELNEIEVTKLSSIEFRIMVIRIFKDLRENFRELH